MTLTHLLIESRDQTHFLECASTLAAAGTPTLLYLIDDGVNCLALQSSDVFDLIAAGGAVWADDTSLAERGMHSDQILDGVVTVDMNRVAPLLFDPAVKVVWH